MLFLSRRRLNLLASVFFIFLAEAAQAQNLVQNGSFTSNAALFTTFPGYAESGSNPTNISGWTIVNGTRFGLNGAGTVTSVFGPTTSGGNTFLFLQNAPIELAQTLPKLMPNTTYTVSVQAAGRYQPTESNDLFQVQIGDSAIVYFTSGTVLASNTAFQAYTYTFTTPTTFSGTPSIQLYNVSASGDQTVDFTAISVMQTRTTAATLTWTNRVSGNASGSWATPTNWSGGTLPTIALDTANFNALDLTANSIVTLDGNQTINTLNFSDANPATAASWILNAGSPTSSTLTLGGVSPAISVTGLSSGSAAVINAVLAGTNGFTFSGTSYLQLNGANTYSGTTIISGSGATIAFGNNRAFGFGTIQEGGSVGTGQMWFNPSGNLTLTNAMEIRTIRWIINNATVNGVSAGPLTVNGNVLFNTGSSGVRDIYCNEPLTINGNVSVSPATNPLNKQGGYSLTLNGMNTVGGGSTVNAGALIVNGPMNGAGTFTVASGGTLGGTGDLSGSVVVQNGGTLMAGVSGSGTLTCGALTANATSFFSLAYGATNNPANGLIRVNGNLTLAGTLNLTDLGGLGIGTYTNFYYSGTLVNNGLTLAGASGSSTALLDTSVPHYVLTRLLAGTLSPAAGSGVPMNLVNPLALSWVQIVNATNYDVYLGTVSNSVANATTGTAGIYLGRTYMLTLNATNLQPNTTYYWRVDGVLANGTVTKGAVQSFVTGAAMADLMQDTWVATDALGRSLPGFVECGAPRTNRPVGIFYFLWHTQGGLGSGGPRDNTQEILRLGGYASPHTPWASNPLWNTAGNGVSWYWGQPENGYYANDDEWVIRRHVALLEAAGVDVIGFDSTNGHPESQAPNYLKIMVVIRKMELEGTPVHLKIFFYTHAGTGGSPATVTWLYNNFYKPGLYSDLWFLWQGKPVIIGYPNGISGDGSTPVSSEMLNYFTWKTGWANGSSGAEDWQWIDTPTPQNFGFSSGRTDLPEQTSVACGGWANGNLGRSNANGQQSAYDNYDLSVNRTEGKGIFFSEQAFQGQEVDPQFLWVTGWNEWWAGAWVAATACYTTLLADCTPAGDSYFVDNYNAEYSRDIEPMLGGFTDNYYYQLVANVRKRKGVRPVPAASAPQTINLNGDFSDWTNVAPEFRDVAGDTGWRNWPGTFSNLPNYTNSTGRNDLTLMKVARDANNFYFFAQCVSNITTYTGAKWMNLFIDADQNHATGWEGYDYAVNLGPVGAGTTTLSQDLSTTNVWAWTTVRSDIAYKVNGNQLMLTIPRAALGLTNDPVTFDFHWADNYQTNDISGFFLYGDSAPNRRFNYSYTTITNTSVTLLADDFENGKQSVWGETWASGSRWNLTAASPYAGNNCAVGSYATTGQSNLIARVSSAGYGSFRLNFHYKLTNVLNAQRLQISYLATNGWVPIQQLSRDEFYPVGQSWSYDQRQNVWLNFTDTRFNSGPDAQFFTTNFAFRIDASALNVAGQSVCVDSVNLTANTQMPATVSPQTWQTQDIGHAGNTGYAATNGGTFNVSGSGLDIWNNGDAFRIYYQTRIGDGTLTAHVVVP